MFKIDNDGYIILKRSYCIPYIPKYIIKDNFILKNDNELLLDRLETAIIKTNNYLKTMGK